MALGEERVTRTLLFCMSSSPWTWDSLATSHQLERAPSGAAAGQRPVPAATLPPRLCSAVLPLRCTLLWIFPPQRGRPSLSPPLLLRPWSAESTVVRDVWASQMRKALGAG